MPGLSRSIRASAVSTSSREETLPRRRDQDRIHTTRANEIRGIIKNLHAPVAERFEFLRRGAANRGEFGARHLSSQQVIRMEFPHVAHADDAQTNSFHAL
jgi:hypothetical protein